MRPVVLAVALLFLGSAIAAVENDVAPKGTTARVLQVATSYLGTPYRFGGTSRQGIDPSGLIWRVFREAGVWPEGTPRTASAQQWQIGTLVPKAALTLGQISPGDRLYFDNARLGCV